MNKVWMLILVGAFSLIIGATGIYAEAPTENDTTAELAMTHHTGS